MKIGSAVRTPAGNGIIDAEATHPDGARLVRVNDHWFEEKYLD